MPKKAIGYIRVSTDWQAQDTDDLSSGEGKSIDFQRAKIEAWASLNDSELIEVYKDEGASGKDVDRPGFQAALDHACKEKAALVVYSLTRMSRSTQDALRTAEQLRKSGGDLVLITEQIDTTSPIGKLMFTVMAAFAQFECEMIAQRTRDSHLRKQRQGKLITRPDRRPYGYDIDQGVLIENTEEQANIQTILRYKDEGLNLSEIRDALKDAGIRNRIGRYMTMREIEAIIRRA